MQAGDRKQVRQSRGAERVVVGGWDAARDAGQQGDRHRASRAGHDCQNMLRDNPTQPLHHAQRRTRRPFGKTLQRPKRVPGAGAAVVPRVALEVPRTGIGGRHRPPDQRAQPHHIAGGHLLRVALLQPNPQPTLQLLPAVLQRYAIQPNAPAFREHLHRAHVAGKDDGMGRQHRLKWRTQSGELSGPEANGRRAHGGDRGTKHRMPPDQQCPAHGRNCDRQSKPDRRFAAQRKVAKHAATREHRQPGHKAALFGRLPGAQPSGDRLLHARQVNGHRLYSR